MNNQQLADLLLPDINKTPDYYYTKYPERNLPSEAIVTRYAPSPTGFQHLGSVFAALVEQRSALLTNGVFYLRIEDTDQKREVKGAIKDTINTMNDFGIEFHEGVTLDNTETGNYGPYKQSSREDIYKSFVKDLIVKGLAYPCFCTNEELDEIRKKQESQKITPGYYGEYALYRDTDFETVKSLICQNKPYVIRLKSPGTIGNKIILSDVIKGDISMDENIQDIVILKSDGLPTYHFAHAVDDTLMRTTHVIRGEEWLPSTPIHIQLFEILGQEPPKYAHIPNLMKMDGSSKRKLSKRKDPELATSYYKKEGYPYNSVIEYLLTIINSDFEAWRMDNPNVPYTEFNLKLNKMSKSGALFDIVKLNDVSKNIISKMDYETVYNLSLIWAKEYDVELYDLLHKYENYSKEIFNIDRDIPKPRKDFGKWNEVRENISYFYDELFSSQYDFPENITLSDAKNFISQYINIYNFDDDKETWFSNLKDLAIKLGYAKNKGEYKKNPDNFKGVIADTALILRVVLTTKHNTPDLYTIMQVMGKDRVLNRLHAFLDIN